MKQCKTCGETKPLEDFARDKRIASGRGSRCKQCATAYAREKYNSDIETSRALKRAYADANREMVNAASAARAKKHREQNPELARQQSLNGSRKFTAANPEYHRDWYRTNIESERQRSKLVMRRVRRDKPELARATKQRYRKKNAAAIKVREREKTYSRRARQPWSAEMAALMAEIVKRPCAYCGATENITIDHIVPLARGGKHEADNLAPACFPCNSSKCDRLLSEWQGRLTSTVQPTQFPM